MIRFGAWSTLLGLGALFGAVVAVLLLRSPHNRIANRLLAALITVLVLRLGPYILGFAGAYDAWPWLSFAPFDLGLAIGPLLWLTVRQLMGGALPARAWRHLLPALLQLVYGAVMLPMPLAFKNRWDAAVQAPWISPAETALELLSLATYLALAWRGLRRADTRRDGLAAPWAHRLVLAFGLMLVVWAPYQALVFAAPLDYYQRFPLYVGLTALVYFLGLEGWRHAALRESWPAAAGARSSPPRDWRAEGERWLAATESAGWYRDPALGLDGLARRLGTNTAYLSRAFNEGLGLGFNDAINGLRVAALRRSLGDPADTRDLLTLAFEAGFSSKASFNRIFKSHTGQTPSQARQARQAQTTERPKS